MKTGRPKKNLEDIKFDGWQQLDALIVWSDEVFCAEKLDMSVDSLARRIKEKTGLSFAEYKNQKKEAIRINLRKKQYDVAMAGNVSMLIWLGKNELGQTDKNEAKVEITEKEIDEVKEAIKRLEQ
jgi:hypothetical protein